MDRRIKEYREGRNLIVVRNGRNSFQSFKQALRDLGNSYRRVAWIFLPNALHRLSRSPASANKEPTTSNLWPSYCCQIQRRRRRCNRINVVKVRRDRQLLTSANESTDKHWNYFRSVPVLDSIECRYVVSKVVGSYVFPRTSHGKILPSREAIIVIRLFSLFLTKFRFRRCNLVISRRVLGSTSRKQNSLRGFRPVTKLCLPFVVRYTKQEICMPPFGWTRIETRMLNSLLSWTFHLLCMRHECDQIL